MVYRSGSWGPAQQVRLIWLAEIRNDVVCAAEQSAALVADAIGGDAVDPDTGVLLVDPPAWRVEQQLAAAVGFDTAMPRRYGGALTVGTGTDGPRPVTIVDTATDQLVIQTISGLNASSYRRGYTAHVAGRIAKRTIDDFVQAVQRRLRDGPGVIGGVIVATLTWGVIIYSIASAGLPAFSPQFNQAVGDGIGTTLTISMLTALSLNAVGFLVTVLLAIIDAVLYLICSQGDAGSITSGYLGGECFSTFGFLSTFAGDLAYQSGQMLDDNADLTEIGTPDLVLGNPRDLYVAGNTVQVTLPIKLNAKEVYDDGWSNFYAIPYLPVLYTPGNLASSTFNFTLTEGTDETVAAERGTMAGSWTDVVASDSWGATQLNKGTATKTVTGPAITLAAGLNQKVRATLNTGYALPMFECTAIPFPPPVASYCWKNSNIGSSSDALDPLVLDVLPADVDAFMAVRAGIAGLDARDVVLQVAGTNTPTVALATRPPAFSAADGSTIAAYVLVPYGTVRVGEEVFATGSFIAGG